MTNINYIIITIVGPTTQIIDIIFSTLEANNLIVTQETGSPCIFASLSARRRCVANAMFVAISKCEGASVRGETEEQLRLVSTVLEPVTDGPILAEIIMTNDDN